MIDLLDHNEEIADGNVVFYDGFLYIICREIDGVDDFALSVPLLFFEGIFY